ncbi:unnamed protein product [Symbiodinium microadriaticum]|nr:unnamed protein product [Symbiodinium microadriaticum]
MPFDFPPPKRREDFGPSGINRRVRAFIRDLDMGEAALDLLQSLEEDLQIEIIEQFDIQGCPGSSPGDFILWQPTSTAMSVPAAADQELEHKEITKAASSLSQCTTLAGDSSPGELSPEILTIKPDVENALEQPDCHAISIWTRKSIGVVIGGFLLAFLTAICSAVTYGFFLGYMGLDSYVMSSITQLMKLPQVLLLPFGFLTDCCPIRGNHRKPYFLLSWCLAGCALLAMSLRPLPAPFYCQNEDGSYNFLVPPCNPNIHTEKNWYVFWMFILTAGIQLGITAGEGLLLEYSQREPAERRGQIKAEMTMVSTGGALAASVVVGVFMNSKAYLGTFDWGLSFSGLMALCFVLVVFMIPLSVCCVLELPKPRQRVDRISCGAHVKSSWELVQKNTFSNLLFFAFLVQLLFSITTTAGPMVKSRWAEVKVLQQQTFGIVGLAFMMLATWIYKVCLLQTSWRKAIFVAIVTINVFDAIPTFLTIFGVVRNQYFYLGEDILGCIPMAGLQLVANLMIIELAEPGREGLCYGLIGTFQSSSTPFGAVVSNQIFGLFNPKLSKLENYVADTSTFRSTVAWSYVLTYSSSFVALFLLPMIPFQKEDAQRRKKESGSSSARATLVIVIPTICLIYGIIVLLLTSQEETACLQWIGGQGEEGSGEFCPKSPSGQRVVSRFQLAGQDDKGEWSLENGLSSLEEHCTRDGNVRSRFLSFVRGMWCRRLGVNREVTEFLRDLAEDIQVGVLKEFDPRGTKDGNVSARLYSFAYARSWKRAPKGLRDPEELEAFVHHWQLDASARQVLEALPDEVLVEVLQGFDASNTRDGNVTGRFLGYVRRKWAQHYELEDDCIFTMKRLPEEGQILCLTTFDPWTTRDGNISARLRSFLWKIEAQVTDNARWWDSSSRYDKYYGKSGYDRYDDYSYDYDDVQPRADRATRDAILKFVARWDLDLATGAYLESLKDPDVLARVLEEFDSSGTQDGNVLGRLKALSSALSRGLFCIS